jgi:hypothetical protein
MNITPEQEKIVNTLLKQAVDFLFEEKNAVALADSAKGGNPADVIAQFSVQLLKGQYDAAGMAGKQLDITAMAIAGREVAKIMAQILVLAGVIKPEQAEAVAQEAFQKGVQLHNQSAGGA